MSGTTPVKKYGRLFAGLRRDWSHPDLHVEARGKAPHKPLLLLAVIELFGQGGIEDGRVYVGPQLVEAFDRYWYCVMPPGQRPNLALPFFHLRKDGGFWKLVALPGKDELLRAIGSVDSLSREDRECLTLHTSLSY